MGGGRTHLYLKMIRNTRYSSYLSFLNAGTTAHRHIWSVVPGMEPRSLPARPAIC